MTKTLTLALALVLALAVAGCGGGTDAEKVANDAEIQALGPFDGSLPLVMPDGSTITIKLKIWEPRRECFRTVIVDEALVDQVKFGDEDAPTDVVFAVTGTAASECR